MNVPTELSPTPLMNPGTLAEPLGSNQLDAYARGLAERLQVSDRPAQKKPDHWRRFAASVDAIERARELAESDDDSSSPPSPISDWLLDNFYVIQEQIHDIREHMPASFFRELPKLTDGRARIYVLAHELVSHCDCALDEDLIVRFVEQFQTLTELTIGETWAFPIMLRFVLVEQLQRLCRQLIHEYATRREIQKLLKSEPASYRDANDFPESVRTPLGLLILHSAVRDVELSNHWIPHLDHLLTVHGCTLAELQRMEQHRQANDQVSIGNIITSMRLLKAVDWIDFFETVNPTEGVLRKDPAKTYAAMDFTTRNRYRDAIERLSKRSRRSESEIAYYAYERAESAYQSLSSEAEAKIPVQATDVRAHIGYWLVDEGVEEVKVHFRYRPQWSDRLIQGLVLRHPHYIFFGGLALLNLLFLAPIAAYLASYVDSVLVAGSLLALLALPVSDVAQSILNAVLTRLLPVRHLPKLEFRDGIDPAFPTMVVVPCMLTSERELQGHLRRLENHFLANQERCVRFALLTDFSDSPEPEQPQDQGLVEAAIAGIRVLNQRYGSQESRPFYIFHRKRLWNESERTWMGWERKRGKLLEFGRLLAGQTDTSYVVQEGDLKALQDYRSQEKYPFIITLDADTLLPHGAARRFVGTLAHPLNRPLGNVPETDCIRRGYTILQPRVELHASEGVQTRYVEVQSSQPGVDPYVTAASDVYQDLFGEGSFTGKGIYDLRAFNRTLEGTLPENRILSHDLIEGCHARVALVSEIVVYDSYPSSYDADAKRHHRWVRGDWQIAPWLLPQVPSASSRLPNPLNLLSRWKILDNLRRSLVAPSLLAFLVLAWSLVPSLAVTWTIWGLLLLFHPALLQSITGLLGWTPRHRLQDQLALYTHQLAQSMERAFYAASFLPHRAWHMTDAIIRTIYRMLISRRRLLEWQTAATVESQLTGKRWSVPMALAVCSIFAAFIYLLLPRQATLGATPWLLMWLLAPLIGQILCLPREPKRLQDKSSDAQLLREVASATWGFFEEFVNETGNWLPPDNVQEFPTEKVALRISPTNEGLFLVSGLVAQKLGYTTLSAMTDLWEKNLASWMSLPQLHGHHFNWYDTQTLRELHPKYVSTVDSGNLMACYLTLREGIQRALAAPVLGPPELDGVRDTLRWLRRHLKRTPSGNAESADTKSLDARLASESLLDERLAAFERQLPEHLQSFRAMDHFLNELDQISTELESWLEHFSTLSLASDAAQRNPSPDVGRLVRIVANRLRRRVTDSRRLMPWLADLAQAETTPTDQRSPAVAQWLSLVELPLSPRFLAQWPAILRLTPPVAETIQTDELAMTRRILEGSEVAQDLITRLHELANQCESAAMAMDFRFLYNTRRKLFSIGYNADIGSLDRAHYDLLCSECRLASYLAIAKGDVATEHWFRLGRQATFLDGKYTLLSWGGTMFEYLMPQLFQRSFPGTLIETSCRTAISRQIDYSRQLNIPWGISESAFGAMASNLDYQYKSFGVPGLGLKRGLSKDLVVSPYSSALALSLVPFEASDNLQRLQELSLGEWGYFDAIDYTPRRQRRGDTFQVVRNYMAHHQGMSLLGIANALESRAVNDWFHAHPLVRANELLLQERTPAFVDLEPPHPREIEQKVATRHEQVMVSRHITGVFTPSPKIMVMGNGEASCLITHAGGGYLRSGDLQITRWRSDSTQDAYGSFLYLQDVESGQFWSATFQPTTVQPDHYEARFAVDKAEIIRRQGTIETAMEVVVSPDHNAEVRQLRITNHGPTARTLEVTSYLELVLTTQAADIAHPAFQKLFVQTERLKSHHALLAQRRPRDENEGTIYALHTLALPPTLSSEHVQFETSRLAFVGRGRDLNHPQAMDGHSLAGHQNAVLDPIFSLRCRVTIEPAESVTLGFTTAVAKSQEQAIATADLFCHLRGVQRAFELAWAFAQVESRHLHATPRQVHMFQNLGGLLLYPQAAHRNLAAISANRLGQSTLWRYGISGDHPLLAFHIEEESELPQLREVLAAHDYLNSRGLRFDLVLCNDYPGTYYDHLQDQMNALVQEMVTHPHERRAIHLIRSAQIPAEDRRLIDASSSLILTGGPKSLVQQLAIHPDPDPRPAGFVHHAPQLPRLLSAKSRRTSVQLTGEAGEFFNGVGAFTEQGSVYAMPLDDRYLPPAPWSNVIANRSFGTIVTEAGGGYTWSGNSREFKLTQWSNDPVTDLPAEMLYLSSSTFATPWSPLRRLQEPLLRQVRHGQGWSEFSAQHHGLAAELMISVDIEAPVKIMRLRLRNLHREPQTVKVTWFAETVLGTSRQDTVLHQRSEWDEKLQCLKMVNRHHAEFSRRTCFATMIGPDTTRWTADRTAFLGRHGSWRAPAALSEPWRAHCGAGLDPCLALQQEVTIEPDEVREWFVVLGASDDETELASLIESFRSPSALQAAIAGSRSYWDALLNRLQVETPSRSLDLMVNRWLPYQTLSCRLWARTAFYQAGGAYGFRDQLQDVLGLLYLEPRLAREQILRAASRQYWEGDVQHWWHPPAGRGTRTRFSDDFLFLPFAVERYVSVTGDRSILEEPVPFLRSPLLRPEEHERYEQPNVSDEQATILEHCRRALRHGMQYGDHGLPLMGCGDWNDGMNQVGPEGRGESVWVAWFQIDIFQSFASLVSNSDPEWAEQLRQQAERLLQAIDQQAWDGQWYRRAYFDDGTPLGSHINDACQIDSLTQSWAVIAGGVTERSQQAFQAAVERLFDRDEQLVLLFQPPFDQNGSLHPGYIQGYLPGIRENGGQYTHAGTWMVQAAAKLGDGDLALQLFDALNPIHHTMTREQVERYCVEPYVVAADVYNNPQHRGRGGWTWYTGSAAWLYRVAVEAILGIELRASSLRIRPTLPASWHEFRVVYRRGQTEWKIHVRRSNSTTTTASDQWIELIEDGQLHELELLVPAHHAPE